MASAQPLIQPRLQVCGACDAGSASRWQQEAWRLVEEQMLLEARITLLKLASRLDAIYAEVRNHSSTSASSRDDLTDEAHSPVLRRTNAIAHRIAQPGGHKALSDYGVLIRHGRKDVTDWTALLRPCLSNRDSERCPDQA